MTGCELVTAVAVTVSKPVTARARRVCMHALIRRAAREGAVIVDFRRGRVIMPPVRAQRSGPVEVLQVRP